MSAESIATFSGLRRRSFGMPEVLILLAFLPATPASSRDLPQANCTVAKESVALVHGTVSLPASGAIVIESHLATTDDRFPDQRLFPTTAEEKLGFHLVRSCQILLEALADAKCTDAYADPDVQVWTPGEHGALGQGSVGNLRPPAGQELWSGNMYWTNKSKPAPGTRYLVSRGEKHVVIVMGYETGPTDALYLLGVQSEVAYYLGIKNHATVQVAHLVDQSVSPGPVACQQHG
jgi:hypothetical protein